MRFLLLALVLAGCDRASGVQDLNFEQPGQAEADALADLESRAARGDSSAAVQAVFMRDWLGGDPAEAVERLKPLAEQGYAGAARFVALAYEQGRGVDVDLDKAKRWLALAAEQGDTEATRLIAHYRRWRAERDTASGDAPPEAR